MGGLSRAFNTAVGVALSLLAGGARQMQAHRIATRRHHGPGKRTILNMRPSHPGKPRTYYQRDTVPKHLRRAA